MDQRIVEQVALPRVRVFIADDHPLIVSGMKVLLATDPEIELVGEAFDGSNALRLAIELDPDVVVLDLSMPGLNGFEVTSTRAWGRTAKSFWMIRRWLPHGCRGSTPRRLTALECSLRLPSSEAGRKFVPSS